MLLLLLVLFAVSFFMWLTRSPNSKIAWTLRYPSRKFELSACSLVSPKGWDVIVNRKYNSVDNPKLVFMASRLFEGAEGFPESEIPYISLFLREDCDEDTWLRSRMGRFLQSVQAQRAVLEVDGTEVVAYCYEGPKFLYVIGSGDYEIVEVPEYNSVTIGICSDFGFFGVFWGLPEDEQAFWDVINSIQWNL